MASNSRDMSRAELFEDEKRRIVESCFDKRDPQDGSVLETYITHIKITEYSTSPSGPPPPQTRTPQSIKPRVIIVAVRKSGRVRVHKSKENTNGTFSIGKSWYLDDLTSIESFTSSTAKPQHAEWSRGVGFVVHLGKPYYWEAQTEKEKKFFIASLIKIFSKYTGGRQPLLPGFDQRELDLVLGGAQAQRRPAPGEQQQPQSGRPTPTLDSRGGLSSSLSSPVVRSPSSPLDNVSVSSSYANTLNAQVGRTPNFSSPRPPSRGQQFGSSQRGSSPAQSFDSGPNRSTDRLLQQQQQQQQQQPPPPLRRLTADNQSQDSIAMSATSITARSDDFRPRSRNGPTSTAIGYVAPDPIPAAIPEAEDKPPERKRPPMDPLRPRTADQTLVPAPLNSPAMRREPVAPPPKSLNRISSSSRQNSLRGGRAPDTSVVEAATRDMAAVASQDQQPDPPNTSTEPPLISASNTATSEPVKTPASTDSNAEADAMSPTSTEGAEETRPGLGSMIKARNGKSRGDIKTAFKAAAVAAGAFKPRKGGAADRLLKNLNKSNDGSDGIHGVFNAPTRPASAPRPVEPVTPATPTPPPSAATTAGAIPELRVTGTAHDISRPGTSQGPAPAPGPAPASAKELQQQQTDAVMNGENEENRQLAVRLGNDARYLGTLGIDPTILDNRSNEFTKWLDYFGWVPGDPMRGRSYEEMKVDIDRELNKAQAGGWLARFQEEDERVDAIKKGVDLAINECDELDNLLTLYSVELSTLSDDIAYIEAQGQGLQVQAANQKLLMKELESLMQTCAISERDLGPLKLAALDNPSGIEEIESALVTLYKAMIKIDPALGGSESRIKSSPMDDDSGSAVMGLNSDYGKMRIVQEKKEMYLSESALFMRRLVEFMARQFDEACRATRQALESALAKKVDARNHEAGRDMLWMYSPLVLYARDVDLDNWNRLLQMYQDKCHPVYKAEFREAMDAWKKNARKTSPEDAADLLFTSQQEKKEEGIAMTARKLTVKRSQNLARSFRSPLGDGSSKHAAAASTTSESRPLPYEVFAGIMADLLPLVEMEQNFVIDFFHASTLEQLDFSELVANTRPRDRRGGDLKRHRLMEPDRDLARRVTRAMEVIFAFSESNFQQLVDWVLSMDPLQGVGVLAILERNMADMGQSNQDFVNNMLQKLHGSLEGRFKKFVDDQVRAIEETKVKIKKRKGVISFMRIFPHFTAAVESMLSSVNDSGLTVRRMVDREYDRILKSMFDSLKVIARENPAGAGIGASAGVVGGGAAGSSADPEDKEALNFHILLIENMNHYLEEVDNPRGVEVLDEWRDAAQREMSEHLSLYMGAVMRRPLGRLLEHLENIEAQLAAGKTAPAVAAQPSNSRQTFNKVLGAYDGREVRKGIETLRKRVEKHFSGSNEAHDDKDGASGGGGGGGGGSSSSSKDFPGADRSIISVSSSLGGSSATLAGLSGSNHNLVTRVLRECETFYNDVELRIGKITTTVYGGDVLFEWPRAEVRGAFANIGR